MAIIDSFLLQSTLSSFCALLAPSRAQLLSMLAVGGAVVVVPAAVVATQFRGSSGNHQYCCRMAHSRARLHFLCAES